MNFASNDLALRAMEAAQAIREQVSQVPSIALVLGSGFGSLVDGLSERLTIPYVEIPHFPVPSVAGHEGNLVVGQLDGARLLVLQGRFHYYEG
ncbi:MAG: purine-nucleoside phosphorylase, partial [Isosphaeraceae bacterium]